MNLDKHLNPSDCTSATQYLQRKLLVGRGGHGNQRALAKKTGIDPSYLARVLAAKSMLSPEQAELINEAFAHNGIQSEIFLGLVDLDRAGSQALKKRIEKRLSDLKTRNSDVGVRIAIQNTISTDLEALYYSDPLHVLIHVACSIPKMNSASDVSRVLGISERKARGILELLSSLGVVEKKRGIFLPTERQIHLHKSSPWLVSHHRNLRQLAIQHQSEVDAKDLRYSGAVACSREVGEEVREELLKVLKKSLDSIAASDEEELWVFNVDWIQFA